MSAVNSVNERLQEATKDQEYLGYHVAFVTENNDPQGISLVKVSIPNLLDSDQGPVPWCLPSKYSPFGIGPDYGWYGTPKIGSPVRVSFQDSDPHCPVIEAHEYLKQHANSKFSDPATWGFKDPGGSELFVNYDTGAWEFTHQSGCTVKYDGEGNLTIHTVKDKTEDVGGNENQTVVGNYNQTVQDTSTVNVTGDSSQTVGGNLTITVQGSVDITASGAVNISGSSINLN